MTSIAEWRTRAAGWAADVSDLVAVRYWGFFVTALVLALGFAKYAYIHLNRSQAYSELIVGGIAWTYQNKFHDYAVLYVLAFAFIAALIFIASLAACVGRRAGVRSVERLHDFLLLLNLPAALWFAALWVTQSISLDLLTMSQGAILVTLVFVSLLLLRGLDVGQSAGETLFDGVAHGVLFVIFSGLAVAAIGVAANRLGAFYGLHEGMSSVTTLRWVEIVAACAAVACCGWMIHAPSTEQFVRGMRALSTVAQCFLPLFFFCMLPPAWRAVDGDRLALGYEVTAQGLGLVAMCIFAAYAERLWSRRRGVSDEDKTRIFLPTVGFMIALLLFLKNPSFSLPTRMWDDYHFGEMLVPWWSWSEMGQIPFWDYAPARGLMNYFPGFFCQWVFAGNPAATEATYPFIYALLAVVAIPVLRSVVGTKGTFLALLLGPFANAIGEIDLAVSIFLFAACSGWLRWERSRWLIFMAVAGAVLLLYAPGQAALALLACSPLALVTVHGLYRVDRRLLGRVILGVTGGLAVLAAVTPLGKMLYGAIRYGFEQSSINSIAHGLNWDWTFGMSEFNAWAFELIRTSFILVVLWASVLVFKALALRTGDVSRRRTLAYALPVLIIGLLFVIRAAGRVDPGMSRLGVASVWALSLLAPMLLHVSVQRIRNTHLFGWFVVAGFLVMHAGTVPVGAYASNFDPSHRIEAEETPFSRSLAGSKLASGSEGPEHPMRIKAVRQTIDRLLDPQETYLDLSGRHAMYYYVHRRPAIESAAMYNLVGEKQQLRAIASIRTGNFPAILLSADNVLQDGGPSSLRSNLVYREVLLSRGYKLATIGQQVWMVRADRLDRLTPDELSTSMDLDEKALPLLDPIFHHQDLRDVPASWGRSEKSLRKALSPSVFQMPSDAPASMSAVRVLGHGTYEITGPDPHIRFDVSAAGIGGTRAGVLGFDFSCEKPEAAPMMGVYWSTPTVPEGPVTFLAFRGHQGRLLVPVDSAPSWLLAPRIETLRFDVDGDIAGCEKFSIRNVALFARTAIPSN